ncbi:MAG: GntR family transcriptional regulator [Pseudomonadota bacterium]
MTRLKRVPQDGERDFAGAGGLPFGSPKQDSDGGLKTSLVQLVYETIMAALDAGELTPGSRIIASELATRLGLSRAPVREALAVLAGQGLVELLPDRGAMLRPMSTHDLAAIYEVSAPVAAVGLREAARRIEQGDNAARIRAAMAAIRAAGETSPPGFGFFLVLNDFHYLVNAIAEKPQVDFVLRAVNIEYWNRLLTRAIDMERHAGKYIENYQRITDALLAGDPKSAEAVMLYHADWCVSLLAPETEAGIDCRR